MMFLTTALAVVVAGLAVAVALGVGSPEPMREAVPSRPPVHLPEGPLVGADLHEVMIPQAVRGYRMSDVDAVLDRLRGELDARDAEIARLRSTGGRVS